MAATNPLSQIKAAIVAAVNAHWDSLDSDNPAKVKAGNRGNANNVAKPSARRDADFPHVEVEPGDESENKVPSSSTSGTFIRSYLAKIATDDRTPDANTLDQIEWELLRAALKMSRDKLGLPGLVMTVFVGQTRQTNQDTEPQAGVKRWAGSVALRVQFQVPLTDLLPPT